MPTVPIEEVPMHQLLSDSEWEELENFLDSGQDPGHAMTFPVLQGFLTALVIGPAEVAFSQRFPKVFRILRGRPDPLHAPGDHRRHFASSG